MSWKLLARKMLVAFAVTFGAAVIPALLNWLQHPQATSRDFWFALLAGALAAGLRAALALSPINLVPSDGEHTLGK